MKWPLALTCFLLPLSCILDASHAGCEFPAQWKGRWFESGNVELVTVNGSIMTSKGVCIDKEDDKFLIHDTAEKCHRCIVMHMKHSNVLQYKEAYCMINLPKPSLSATCSALRSDASLISLFRTGAAPMPCPFKGPLEFTYTFGDAECSSPVSTAETCTQESRLLLRYQACANVMSSESMDMELECFATWKEGSTHNLVARLHAARKTNDEDSYRCFIYQQTSNNSWNLAQSGDAACTGFSVNDAARTYKMKQKSQTEYCKYPSWVVDNKLWLALDRIASRLLTSPHNLTIIDRKETRLVCHSIVSINDRRSHHDMNPDRENQVMYIAKATLDCNNGYVCLMFHRRDDHIIEMQLSEWSQQPDDVCNSSTFNSHSTPYTTFITSDPMNRHCPNLGRYEIVSVIHSHTNENADDILGVDGEPNMANVAEVQDVRVTSTPFPGRCRYGSVRRLDIGCKRPDRMEFATSCSDEAPSEYFCHGTWIENDTAYLVASTDVGRYCLVYSASAAATGSRELSVTGHLASCPRASHRHLVSWQVNLTSYAQCGDISTATSWTYRISASVYIFVVLGIMFGRYIAR
ncbi:uncharacterized protein LOC128892926 [Hylaeus anthracinus]|uniref:uncharacterized protein LOC128878228 n=1 Tax=Hylaeus volcanicus TaxID=313075 RepID=UPI0023B86221|nr:uncharacterized protein LOC128878228 [Hylaeus volcanicus]XP_053982224.1 uncharacterized protein LOC128878228 [Hylaeus volcanicus]XP_053982226.1 uncharacterized protein LOC128878228 [Hylaeus volcanicus]XP_054009554.1 uncharacterized protein LOC128892926 [Hylaeus anthracinus]XP_054009555.1 uncharacterized protein LOC128892926 [Hylaeus anthracinus]XP_054009556.1 uncharacterized protein LOC128892926 [Hylaeus anthracinus]XP_054009557.1 uncharacterized protein LOC128892926 [Hylaeus anthracinus]